MQQLVALSTKYAASLAPRTRSFVVGIALVAIALAVGLAYYVRNDGADLYAYQLDSNQVAEVAAALTRWDVPFTAMSDNVKVDPSTKRDVLMRLAAAGVPHRHLVTSAESLQSVNALTPQTLLDAQARTGLEGDLSQGLRGITGVLDAQVKIAPASRGVFIDESSHDASASVVLTLDPETKLSSDSVRPSALGQTVSRVPRTRVWNRPCKRGSTRCSVRASRTLSRTSRRTKPR